MHLLSNFANPFCNYDFDCDKLDVDFNYQMSFKMLIF